MPEPTSLSLTHRLPKTGTRFVLGVGLLLAACQARTGPAETARTPPIGHYEGSLSPAGATEVRAALDIRHPSPGHYEAEFTAPAVGTLNFVADTILFTGQELRLVRPARPGQVLTLTLDGDFWRGTLALDSARLPALLVKRGRPTPSSYRVEELPRTSGSAWLFGPSDTGTPGAALALLPDAETAPGAALWADVLARNGIIVLLMPAVDSVSAASEAPRLHTALRLLRRTAGADTANIGIWAAGPRAATLARLLTSSDSLKPAFVIAQNVAIDAAARTAFRALKQRKLPLLGLYGGAQAGRTAAGLQQALGVRRGSSVRTYRTAGPDLLVPGGLSPGFAPGLPTDVVEWLRGR